MNTSTTVGIEVRAEGTQKAARDLADVDASLKKLNTGLGGTAQPAGSAAQGLSSVGNAGKSAGAGLGAASQSAADAAQKLSGVGASAKKAAEGLGSVSKFASTAKFDKIVSDLGAMGVKLNTSSLHAQKLARAMQQVERERAFQQLAADANLSTLQLAKFRADLGDTRGALATLSKGLGVTKAAMLAFAAAVAFGGQACLEAALQADRLSKAYTTITGSSTSAQQQLSYLYDVSNRLGLQFQQTAASAKTFFAAGKDSSLSPHLNEIFEAVSSAGAALSLSQDDMQGVFLALGQMISKGKVQAEELRGQLGERLPGAFQLAAKAMGMTTAQLDKFMADGKLTAEDLLPKLAKVMQSEFGAAAQAAANGIQGSLNRLSTQWELFKASLIDSDTAVAGINTVRSAIGVLQRTLDVLAKYGDELKAIAAGIGMAVGMAYIYQATAGIVQLTSALKTLLPLVFTNPWFAAAVAIGTITAAIVLYSEKVDAVALAQKSLNAAQENSTEINNALAKSQELSGRSLENYAKIAESTVADIEGKIQRLRESLNSALNFGKMSSATEAPWMAYLMDNGVFDTLNEFEQRLVELREEAAKTGDWQTLQRALNELAKEAKASGKDTAELQRAIEDTQRIADLGIKLRIQLDGYDVTIRKLQQIRYLQKLYDGESVPLNESDWRERRDRENFAENKKFLDELEELYKKTETSKREELQKTIHKLEEESRYLNQRGLTERDRLNAQVKLTAALAKARDDLRKLDEKDKKKDTKAEQAQRYIENIRAEVSKLNGEMAQSWQQKLDIKLDDIAKKGKDAHLSPGEVKGLREEYATAADAKRVRDLAKAFADLDLKIAQAAGDTRKLKELDIAKRMEEEQRKLEALAKTPEEKGALSERLTTYKTSLETEVKVENLQVAADFYEKLAALSGDYSVSTAYQNQLLEAQAEIYRRALGPEHEKFVQEWEKLSRLQNSREWGAGLERSVRSFIADSTNAASQMETLFTDAFTGIGNIGGAALEEIFEKGSFAVDKYFANIFKQIAILAANAATNQLIGGIFGFLANGLSFGGTAAANAVSESTAVQGIMSNIAPVRLCHDGGRVETSGTSRAVPLSLFENAPRYHNGAFLRPDERPAILQTGEQVLSRGDTAGLGVKLDRIAALLTAQASQSTGGTNVVLVDDQRKVKNYLMSPEGQKTFVAMLNQNRSSVQNVANGGRA